MKHTKIAQRLLKFCRSGKILPNLFTLLFGAIFGSAFEMMPKRRELFAFFKVVDAADI